MDDKELLQAIRQIVQSEVEPLKRDIADIKLYQENVTNRDIQLLL